MILRTLLMVFCLAGAQIETDCCGSVAVAEIDLLPATSGDDYSLYRTVIRLRRNGVPDRCIVASLRQLIASTDEVVCLKALASLETIGEAAEPAIDQVSEMTCHNNARIRGAAVRALGSIGCQLGFSRVAGLLLADKSPRVREAAAYALPSTSASESVPYLVAALHDEDIEVRAAAVISLGRIGELAYRSVPSLKVLLRDNGFRRAYVSMDVSHGIPLRYDIIETLGAIGPKAAFAIPDLDTLLNEKDPADAGTRLRAAAAVVLIEENSERGLGVVLEMLSHEDAWVRRDAVSTLGDLGAYARPAIRDIEACVEDEDPAVRSTALRALSDVADSNNHLHGILFQALQDPEIIVVGTAMLSLAGTLKYPGKTFLDSTFEAVYRNRSADLNFHLRGKAAEAMQIAVGKDAAVSYLTSRFRRGIAEEQIEVIELLSSLELSCGYETRVLHGFLKTARTDAASVINERMKSLSAFDLVDTGDD